MLRNIVLVSEPKLSQLLKTGLQRQHLLELGTLPLFLALVSYWLLQT